MFWLKGTNVTYTIQHEDRLVANSSVDSGIEPYNMTLDKSAVEQLAQGCHNLTLTASNKITSHTVSTDLELCLLQPVEGLQAFIDAEEGECPDSSDRSSSRRWHVMPVCKRSHIFINTQWQPWTFLFVITILHLPNPKDRCVKDAVLNNLSATSNTHSQICIVLQHLELKSSQPDLFHTLLWGLLCVIFKKPLWNLLLLSALSSVCLYKRFVKGLQSPKPQLHFRNDCFNKLPVSFAARLHVSDVIK